MKLKYYLRGLGIGIIVTAIIMSLVRQPEKLTDAQIKLRALELGMVEKSVLSDLQEDEKTAFEKEDAENDSIKEEMAALEENAEINAENGDITAVNTGSLEEDNAVGSQKNEEVSENTKEEQDLTVSQETTENQVIAENQATEESQATTENQETAENQTTTENQAVAENQETAENQTTTENQAAAENQGISDQPEKTDENMSGNVTIVGSYSESTVPADNDISQNEVVENYVVVYIESGYSSEYASKKVKEAGLVESALEFKRYLVRNGLDKSIRAGNHEIPMGASMEEIARILCRQE